MKEKQNHLSSTPKIFPGDLKPYHQHLKLIH